MAGLITDTRSSGVNPKSEAPQPYWNTATSTPKVAAIETRFRMTAFSGRNIDWKNIISTTKISAATTAAMRGNRAYRPVS